MNRKKVLVIFSVILIGFSTIFLFYLKSSLPLYEGDYRVPNLSDTVEVFFDEYAVPHVFAKNELDAFFTAGYLMARERLFQMTINAATTEGKLSELFGESQLESDIFLRTWGIPRTAKKLVDILEPESKAILETFCKGVNTYINEIGDSLPIEFKLLRIKPFTWEPKHITGYARLMAYSLSQSWYPEMLFGQVSYMLGEKKALELWPIAPDEKPPFLPQISSDLSIIHNTLASADRKVRNILGTAGGSLGSNSWVIDGKFTRSGYPILANDPHLGNSQPSIWYEMHLVGGRYDVAGAFFPGVPFAVIGQNKNVAWGFTNLMADDLDFYVETVDEDYPNSYLFNGMWEKMKIRKETIDIKGSTSYEFIVRETHRGPIISDIHPLAKNAKHAISFRWTGNELSNEVKAFLGFNRMQDWHDFSQATKDYTVPGQNIIYADKQGNIGWRPAARVPIRKGGSMLVPLPGETNKYDWKGFVDFKNMPYLFNPDEGIIITANNRTIPNEFPYYVSGLWHERSRFDRINELLSNRDSLDIIDMAEIQNDVNSPFARFIKPYLLNALMNADLNNDNYKQAISHLSQWNGDFNSQSTGALIFSITLIKLLENIYSDEMALLGDDYYKYWIGPVGGKGNWGIPLRNLRGIMLFGLSSWIDDINTSNHVETLEEIIILSFKEGVMELKEILGPSTFDWWWGRLHTITHNHAVGVASPFLDRVFNFNIGPFETDGSSTTINNGEYSLSSPFNRVVGPSFRRIVDLSNMNNTSFILPTGQSGLPTSAHYSDQTELYNSGAYRKTLIDEKIIRNSQFRKLTLIPQ
ncbi:MAG: penicillin acylase family protein [SAR202 cluster bacterium]|nr:penicillin acylase family protein [SAR202 cluster bacterium]|tara:strand:- start:2748 stop:5177 length:2430 start_codon:yes stop_codon:yes gene_type:complete